MSLSSVPVAGVKETIHGVVVDDPYRWLEDRDLPETREWVEEQRKRCDDYFANLGDVCALRDRVRAYLDVTIVDQPAKVGDRIFYRRRNKGEEQACIFVRNENENQEKQIVDPSTVGPFASVSIHRISDDGSLLAYELKRGGEDQRAICFMAVDGDQQLPDRIDFGFPRGLAFTTDNRGVYYCHESSTESLEHRILLHLFHESVADQVVFRVARTRGSRLVLTADKFRLGAILIHETNSQFVVDFFVAQREEPSVWATVFSNKRLPYSPILKDGRIFVISFDGAVNGKLVELDAAGSEIRTVVPEQGAKIEQLILTGNRAVVRFLRDLIPSIHWWALLGTDHEAIDIPTDGAVRLLPNRSQTEDTFFYTYESFLLPPTVIRCFPESRISEVWHERDLPIDLPACSVSKISYQSRDNTLIPMILLAPLQSSADAKGVFIMTAYGGFGVSMTPQFSVLVMLMLEFGASFALPLIRGGGEFGIEWYEAGRARRRQTAIDDFIGAAEWLCSEGLATPERIGVFGGSNSGLLVGSVMTQRPDLVGAVLCITPLLDMVRYEYFDQASKWKYEYGTVDDFADFQVLHSYSPYHHVDDSIDYPAVMFVSGDRDERCNPAHVRKMAARLLDRSCQRHPVLVDYSDHRGHSPVLPLSVRIEALVRRAAFLIKELNMSSSEGGGYGSARA
jgi:prolyl oligopeptidase